MKISTDEILKWRVEIDNAEKFKEENFGSYGRGKKSLAGESVDYFDFGISERVIKSSDSEELMVLFNAIHVIVKNVLPSLYYKNPYIISLPKRKNIEDEVSAPYAGAILNYYHRELNIKSANQEVLFNSFVTGMGVSKISYTTKFGSMPTEENVKEEQKEREDGKRKTLLAKLGLRKDKKEKETKSNPELNEYIRSESPYVVSVNPFNFGIDPRATDISNANYVYEIITKRLKDVKEDKEYKNTSELNGRLMKDISNDKVPESQIEDFKLIDIVEIYYKTSEGINYLVLAFDESNTHALRHDKFIYDIDGFPYETLYFNKHPHRLYPISDIEKIKPLQDRITQTIENILDQLDKFTPKLIVDSTGITEEGKRALTQGGIGAIVFTNKNPNEVVREAMLTQIKGDLMVFVDKLMEIIGITVGLTKAQLLGMTQASTATEAQIGQAGQNLRTSDKTDSVNDFLNRQARKLWQVTRQFVDLEEISLITGEESVDSRTGIAKYSWMPDINPKMAEKLSKGEYRFDIAVGSSEKPDLPILRKQIENFVNILGGKGVLQAIAAQGYKIELVEIIREYLSLFPDMFNNPGRIIKPMAQQPQVQGGGNPAANQQLAAQPPPNMADIISGSAGEKGGQIPLA
jgi:hypothetical protein